MPQALHLPKPFFRILATAFCVLTSHAMAEVKNDGLDPSLTFEKINQHFVVNPDGTFVLTMEEQVLINDARAIQGVAQKPLSYNRTLESLDIDEAYTQKPDGRKVPVQASQIKEQQEAASADAPMFQDSRVKVLIYPEVAVGDRLFVRFHKTRSTPLFPGQFDYVNTPPFNPVRQFTLTYDMPENMVLRADNSGFTASLPAAAQGRKVYRWDYVPAPLARVERDSVNFIDYGQRLAVSTFADYPALGRAYAERANDKARATPKITELARSLTTGLDTPRDKALALGEWVRKNIRYVAVYIGPGGVVPHAAQDVLDNRYGDCKDHVVLLEALLSALDIPSTPALVNLGNVYALLKVPSVSSFNHVITYIPSLDLYIDSTAEAFAAGYLPHMALDKPVVLTSLNTMARTPLRQTNAIQDRFTFKVATTGAADFSGSSQRTGMEAGPFRYVFKNMPQIDRDLLVQRILGGAGQKGEGKLDLGNLEAPGDYTLKLAGQTENLVNLPGPIGMPVFSSLVSEIGRNAMVFMAEKERTQDYICLPQDVSEQSRTEFPSEVEVLAVPKNTTVRTPAMDFTSTYTREANAVTVQRRYQFHHSRAVCNPQDFKNLQPAYEAMLRDLRGQIVVQAR